MHILLQNLDQALVSLQVEMDVYWMLRSISPQSMKKELLEIGKTTTIHLTFIENATHAMMGRYKLSCQMITQDTKISPSIRLECKLQMNMVLETQREKNSN